MWSEPPWENAQSIPWQGQLPRTTFLQDGWKELEHAQIQIVKNKIAELESHEEWELRKKITNPYEAIFTGNSDSTFPSLAQVHPLSRSYFKMIEMLQVIDFWQGIPKSVQFRSAHICEGPGGFLQAVIERLKKDHRPIDALHAMTLRPTKSHIPGWRRSIQFLRKYPQIQLEYGQDDTGNILVPENQRQFSQKAHGAHIFTADGGFDFSVDYGNQEQMAFPLLLASFTIGLSCLAKGGTMIIKLFDIYSAATQDLFLGTARLFGRFMLYKPATSRPCNSERYFIASDYCGNKTPQALIWIRHLQDAQLIHAESPLTRLTDDWPPEIMRAIKEQIQWQERVQISVIEETLGLQMSSIATKIERSIALSKKWCETFRVPYTIST